MSTRYTPGPWRWIGDNALWSEKDGEVIESGDDGKPWGMHSAEIHHHYDTETKEANKALIAAAPNMYEALLVALEALEAISDEMTIGERYTNAGQYLIDSLTPVREVIAKVEGKR